MRAATEALEAEADSADHSALRLMLSYVEAECLRIGALEAARHAALAAALVRAGTEEPATEPKRAGLRGGRFH